MARNAYQLARHVIGTLRAAGHEALLAGGCVRDLLLGLRPKDYDVATSARPKQVGALFRRTRRVGAAFGVMLVRDAGQTVEVATFRTDHGYSDGRRPDRVTFSTARRDAARRDFTINGMFYDPAARRVIDYVGGRDDLRRRCVRAIGNPSRRFAEDYLRMLRAVRFTARLGFTLEPRTAVAIRRHADRITQIAAERVREELAGVLSDRHRGAGVRLAWRLGLLERILPEVEAGAATPIAILTALPRRASLPLCMATLLGPVGSDAAAAACRRLRCTTREVRRVAWLADHRDAASGQVRLSDADFRRLAGHDGFGELCAWTLAAAKVGCAPSASAYRAMRRRAAKWPVETLLPPALLTGESLKQMGYAPGPRFGKALRAVYDAQLNGEIRTHAQARRLVAGFLQG